MNRRARWVLGLCWILGMGLVGCLWVAGDFGLSSPMGEDAAADATLPDGAVDHAAEDTARPDAEGGADADAAVDADAGLDVEVTPCGPATCPQGCCDGHGTCQPGTAAAACGAVGGIACPCAAGQECSDAGKCECTLASCSGGCCSEAGACVTYAAQDAATCGSAGAACAACAAGQACDVSSGRCACTAASCTGGCCVSDGGCVVPPSSPMPGASCAASEGGCPGVYVCAEGGTSRVICNAPTTTNECGGCTALKPEAGARCSTMCGVGTYVCNPDGGKESVVCNAPPVDLCGGCTMVEGTSTACLHPTDLCLIPPGTCNAGGVCSYNTKLDCD